GGGGAWWEGDWGAGGGSGGGDGGEGRTAALQREAGGLQVAAGRLVFDAQGDDRVGLRIGDHCVLEPGRDVGEAVEIGQDAVGEGGADVAVLAGDEAQTVGQRDPELCSDDGDRAAAGAERPRKT